jgi:hypothetical protein
VVPSRFPYISVEWSLEGRGGSSGSEGISNREGVAHVVEDSTYFTNHFCLDVIAGALDIDPFILRKISNQKRKSQGGGGGGQGNESSGDDEVKERASVDSFRRVWSAYDWTQSLE